MSSDVIGALPALPVTPAPEVPWWPTAPVDPPTPQFEHRFVFDGQAGEYFRIWIVNLALTILTLGIYSAWAKVRTQRYFYGNTRLAGVPFEYLAKPLPILKGRLIAISIFVAYVVASQSSIILQLLLLLVLVVATPWLLVLGMVFRARYSAWRGLTFRFVPDYAEAYIRYMVMLLPLILTLGLLYPWIQGKQKQFVVENHRYGGSWFRFLLDPGKFYIPYLIAWGVMTAWFMGVMMLMAGAMAASAVSSGTPDKESFMWITYVFITISYAGYFVVLAFLKASLINLFYNHVELDGRRLQSRLRGKQLLWLYFSNTVAILLSLGLMIPWAMVRLARYRAECMSLFAMDDLNDLRAERRDESSATAAEMDGLFDIDISL